MPGSKSDFIPEDTTVSAVAKTGGEWVVDPQDGCRFFVPSPGTKRYPHGLLKGEAVKCTNKHSLREQRRQNAISMIKVPLNIVTLGATRSEHWRNNRTCDDATSDSGVSDDWPSLFSSDDQSKCKEDGRRAHDDRKDERRDRH